MTQDTERGPMTGEELRRRIASDPRLSEAVYGALYDAFESGWFDNIGDIGDGWCEVKEDLHREAMLKITDALTTLLDAAGAS